MFEMLPDRGSTEGGKGSGRRNEGCGQIGVEVLTLGNVDCGGGLWGKRDYVRAEAGV